LVFGIYFDFLQKITQYVGAQVSAGAHGWQYKCLHSVLWRRVVWQADTDVSVEHIASLCISPLPAASQSYKLILGQDFRPLRNIYRIDTTH
jgi:hypothetical protein